MLCICCSAAAESSAKRTPTRELCFMNFSQHRCTHCKCKPHNSEQQFRYAFRHSTCVVSGAGMMDC